MMPSLPTILVILALGQPAASPDPKPVPIAGVVADTAGRPVSGADIWLVEAVPPAEERRSGPEILEGVGPGPIPAEARTLAHTRTDADGKFTIAIPAEVVARPDPPVLAIWAATLGPEPRVAWHRLPRMVLPDDPPVRIALGTSAHFALRIVSPDRKPVAGARVIPARAGGTLVPSVLGQALAATADANGLATITRPAAGGIDEVRVEAEGFGTHSLEIASPEITNRNIENSKIEEGGGPAVLVLASVGRIRGRLVAPHGEPIRGVVVRATSQVGGYAGSVQGGSARAVCDEQGRFEIPAIAAGMMDLAVECDDERGPTIRPWPLSKILVRAGRTTEVTIPLHPMVKVRGLVRERGTERPIAGAAVSWNMIAFDGPIVATTDVAGTFRGLIARECIIATPTPIRLPGPFLIPADRADANEDLPPRGVDELTLKPVDVSRGVEVSGTVVDQRGEPVAGAEVEAIRPAGPTLVRWARSDAAGRFVLHGVDPRAELILRAWESATGSGTASFAPDALASEPIVLTLGPGHTTPIGGRVVDPDGRPIPGASVRLWREVRSKGDGYTIVIDPIVHGDGSAVLRTDAQGRFRSRRRFPADCVYIAQASAPGRLSARSAAITMADGEFPPLVLRRLRTIEGRIVDRQGRPVAGAVVFQSGDGPMPTEATSDAEGRFSLPGFPEGPALVFARKDRYRLAFAGCDVPSGDPAPQPVTVALTRVDETPAVVAPETSPALPAEEERTLARRLIRPEADRVLARGTAREKYAFLSSLAAFDPDDALERLETARFADASDAASIRIVAAGSLAAENLDEGRAVIESIATPDDRALGYLTLIGTLPHPEPARVRPLLDQAIVNVRAATHENVRLYLLSRIGRSLIEQGEVERARDLLREGEDLTRKLYRGEALSRRLSDFAGQLLMVEPAAALPHFEELSRQAQGGKVTVRAFGMDRPLGRAAHHFAASNPAEAERLLRRVSFTLVRPANMYVVAVCARMAPADLPRARKLLGLITDDEKVLKAYALGLMAEEMAPDRTAALALLDEAYAELEHLVDRGWTSQFASICGVAGPLLSAVERVDASRLPDFLARALALRPPAGGRNDHAYIPERSAELAMSVARYDRTLAARILQPLIDTLEAAPNPSAPVSFAVRYDGEPTRRVLVALALIDPRRAVGLTEKLAGDEGNRASEGRSRLRVARILALHGDARRRSIQEHELNLWNPLEGVD